MAYKKKTWREKLEDNKNFPKILKFDPKFPCGRALQKMGAKLGDPVVLVQPREVDEIMKEVPKGKVITIKEICERLAKKHHVKYCCTLTAGIFITIAANAAEETGKNEKNITPYWRTLKINGYLNDKYPGGSEEQKKRLEEEGNKVVQKGKKFFVMNYKNKVI